MAGFPFGLLICVMLVLQKGYGTDFTVGGSRGWAVPMAQTYNQWAEANRFQIGDSLVFNYAADQDSVLQVTQDDYNNCSIQSPISKYSDGHTVFQFEKSGPYYFISGDRDNCLKNEKLLVVVLADRSNSSSNQTSTLPPSPSPTPSSSPSPSPSPSASNSTEITPSPAPENDQTGTDSPPPGSTDINPSPAPAEEINPSPAPAGEVNPSSPPPVGEETPSGSTDINPTPTPAPVLGRRPLPSAGLSIIPSSIGSIGAFVAVVILAS